MKRLPIEETHEDYHGLRVHRSAFVSLERIDSDDVNEQVKSEVLLLLDRGYLRRLKFSRS